MKFLLTTSLCLIHIVVNGQLRDVIPPSPNSSELVKFIDNPVSFYTGNPNISLSLYDLKVKDFTLPINLNYNSSGIKVDERASNIGLGWSLDVGGIITRTVNGMPDDLFKPNCVGGPSNDCRIGLMWNGRNLKNIDLDEVQKSHMTRNDFYFVKQFMPQFFTGTSGSRLGTISWQSREDSEPDEFYFRFGNKSGKFVFDYSNGTPSVKLFPYQDLKFEYTISDHRIASFKVTDESGVQYLFDNIEVTQRNVDYQGQPTSDGNWVMQRSVGHEETNFNSSWLLTKIITPLSNTITLTYVDDNYLISNETALENFIRSGPRYIYRPITSDIQIINGKRLSVIESPVARINFNSTFSREDYRPYKGKKPDVITEIEILNSNSNRIKKMSFSYDYFLSSTLAEPGDTDFVPSINQDYYKRLRLKGIKEFGTGTDALAYDFDYKYSDYTGDASHILPRLFSSKQDLWGVYNGAVNNKTLIPATYIYPDMYSDDRQYSVYQRNNHIGREYYFEGADRLPNSGLADVGMLTKIHYPTGGYTAYEYELNRFNDGFNEYNGGGLRIKTVRKNDGFQNINYSYKYLDDNNLSSGRIIAMPMFALLLGTKYPLDKSREAYWTNLCLYSSPRTGVGTTQGAYVGYTQVTENIQGNGKTIYRYGIPASWFKTDDLPGSGCNLIDDGYCDGLFKATKIFTFIEVEGNSKDVSNWDFNMFPATMNSFPFVNNPNYDWNRGYLTSQKTYNENNQLLLEKVYDYKLFYPNKQTTPTKVYGLRFGQFDVPVYSGSAPKAQRIGKYEYLTDVAKVPSTITETNYWPDDIAKKTSIITQFNYAGTKHLNVNESRLINSKGETIVTSYKYPQDYITSDNTSSFYPETEGVAALLAKGINSIPVEKTVSIENGTSKNVIASDLTTYKLVGNLALPYVRYHLQTSSPINDFFYPNQNPNALIGFIKDPRYSVIQEFKSYNSQGDLLTLKNKSTVNESYIWGYNNQYITAYVKNAENGEFYYEGYEDRIDNSILPNGHTGIKFTTNPVVNWGRPNTRSYLISYWYLTQEGWRYSGEIPYTTGTFTMQTAVGYDDVRIYPEDAQMINYTYDPLVGMTSSTDPKGMVTYYENDGHQRLKNVKDQNGNIIKSTSYHYKN
ncbi:hypothetical protein HDE69_002572 [Pedobacter cryoconitis]|uniref:YD repeat-containing protein n=1 Tax=Pedobacter cryoconitis TaxID=188932 RepID=A0A7W8YTI1_9SPHI|nr:hypothetical protein [Pedobacter cryoconitis]MBB5621511.1 hypothetical protein [Pedobacter cryoconitis]